MKKSEIGIHGCGGAPLIFLACVSWSFSGLLGKITEWNALSLFAYRALIASILLGCARHSFRVVSTTGNWLGASGVFLTSLLFMYANKLTTAANAIVLQYAMPVFVLLYGALIQKQRPGRRELVAVCGMLLGVVLCFCQGVSAGGTLGNLLALLSAVTWSMVFLSGKRPDSDALTYAYMGNLLSCAFLFALPNDAHVQWTFKSLVVPTLMGLCMGGGYWLFNLGMRRNVSAVTAALVANVEPVLNPVWVFLFMGENPGALSIAGVCIVITGVVVYMKTGR